MRPWLIRLLAPALVLLASGCGRIVIPAWINIVEEESSLDVTLLGVTIPVAIEGGIFAEIVIDPSRLASGIVTGNVRIEDVRIVGDDDERVLGTLCLWRNVDAPNLGSISVNIFDGTSSLELPLALRAYSTRLAPLLRNLTGSDILEISPSMGEGGGVPLAVDPNALLGAFQTGSVTGLIELPVVLGQVMDLGGIESAFTMDLLLRTDEQLPLLEPGHVEICQEHFDQQGRQTVFPVNSKGTYLRYVWDSPQPPTTVALADVGAVPGDTLRIRRRGSYFPWINAPNWHDVVALFSSSPDVHGDPLLLSRVPGAIDAGADVWTPLTYFFGQTTNIAEDFLVMDSVDVVVPPGATHLLFTTLSESFLDNANNGLRVELTVNP
jgi:hypothetical protein